MDEERDEAIANVLGRIRDCAEAIRETQARIALVQRRVKDMPDGTWGKGLCITDLGMASMRAATALQLLVGDRQ